MPSFQLMYLGPTEATEMVEADSTEDAEDLAKMRLLFSEPGLAIAVMSEGHEVCRVTQRPCTSSHSGSAT